MGQTCSGSRAKYPYEHDDSYTCSTTLKHASSVNGLCMLPNGRLVSATENSVQVWTFTPIIVYKEIEVLGCVSLCPVPGEEGHLATTTISDIKIIDVETSKAVRTIEEKAVSLCPISENLLAAGVEKEHGLIQIFDIRSDSNVKNLRGHTKPVRALTMVPDNNYLISGSHDNTIKVWDLKGTEAVRTMKGHTEPVVALTFLYDGRLVSGSFDRTIMLWDPWSGSQVGLLEGHSEGVNTVCVTGDQKLVSGSDDRTIRVWNVNNKTCHNLLGHESFVYAVCAVDDDRIASASNDRTVKIWGPKYRLDEAKRDSSLLVSETKNEDNVPGLEIEARGTDVDADSGPRSPSQGTPPPIEKEVEATRPETPPPVIPF